MDSLTNILWSSVIDGGLTAGGFFLCTAVSVLLGLGIALLHSYQNKASRSFLLTLALLPAIVQVIILMVNGNIGAGVAVAGTFSLIRFRSAPGNGREITAIFLAMAVGLATGMGYVGAAVLFFAVMALVMLVLLKAHFGEEKPELELRITVPENLEFNGMFDDLLDRFTDGAELMRVKTTGMGSMYELKYQVRLKAAGTEKQLMDEIRCRNGNLTVSLGRTAKEREEL